MGEALCRRGGRMATWLRASAPWALIALLGFTAVVVMTWDAESTTILEGSTSDMAPVKANSKAELVAELLKRMAPKPKHVAAANTVQSEELKWASKEASTVLEEQPTPAEASRKHVKAALKKRVEAVKKQVKAV